MVETPVFVITDGEEAVTTSVLVWTLSTKVVVVMTTVLVVSAESYQYFLNSEIGMTRVTHCHL